MVTAAMHHGFANAGTLAMRRLPPIEELSGSV
jgi:hypothetical protein